MAFTSAKWWHTDAEGREIGWLYPEDFVAILEAHYGVNKSVSWVLSFAQANGLSRAQVDRYAKGKAPIPRYLANLVSMMGTLSVRKIPFDPVQADWLPDVEGANAKLGVPFRPLGKNAAAGKGKIADAAALIRAGGVIEHEADEDEPKQE